MSKRRFFSNRNGTTAVEFAIVAPVFIALMFGIVQLGLGFYNAATVQWTLDRAARKAVVNSSITAAQLQDYVSNALADLSQATATLTYNKDTSGTFPIIQLGTTYVYTVSIPFAPDFNITYHINTRIPVPQP